MPKIISPIMIDQTDARNLYEFFQTASQRGEKVWPKNLHFTIHDIEYVLGYTVIQRKRKPGKEGLRFELMSDLLIGEGCYNTCVYQIAGTMALTPFRVSFSKVSFVNGKIEHATNCLNKTRVVKVQQLSEHIKFENVIHEYEMSMQAGHLAIKPPTVYESISYTVMQAVNGIELFDVLSQDYDKINILTLKQRLELSKALLRALKEQVTDKKLIHRDVKPENILVNMNQEPILVKFIDYARSDPIANPREDVGGTAIYAAPEIFTHERCTEKTDIFPMGKILAFIWGLEPECCNVPAPDQETDQTLYREQLIYYAIHLKDFLKGGLFKNIDDLSYPNRALITSILGEMLEPNLHHRCSIEHAIIQFDKVNLFDVTPLTTRSSQPTTILGSIWRSFLLFTGQARPNPEAPVRQSAIIEL